MRCCRLYLLLFCYFLIFLPKLYSQEIKTFEAETKVQIKDIDIDFARNNVFQILKKEILTLALADLIGEVLLKEYQSSILNRGKISSNKYITSVKILREKRENSEFSMKLQGTVQMDLLREALEAQQLIFRDDPFKDITFIIEQGVQLPIEQIKERLEQFRLRIEDIEYFNPDLLDNLEQEPVFLAKELFLRYPENNIILFARAINDRSHSGMVKGILFRIFRRTDFKLLGKIRWSLSNPTKPENLIESLVNNLDKNLARFSLHSLKIGDYEGGEKEDYLIRVDGINTPYKQYVFERRILKINRQIKSFRLSELSKNTATYKIQAKAEIKDLNRIFEKENPYFDLIVIEEDYSDASIYLLAHWKNFEKSTQMPEWEINQSTVDQIKEVISPEAENLDSEWVPSFTEREPNNRSHEVNIFFENNLITGRVSSRSDADIYKLSGGLERSVLVIDWVRFGKTALSPQLKLYDENFALLGAYRLSKSQNKLRIHYQFSELPISNIFIQISDELGFIPDETGGYKSYSYLLKYWWENGSNQTAQ